MKRKHPGGSKRHRPGPWRGRSDYPTPDWLSRVPDCRRLFQIDLSRHRLRSKTYRQIRAGAVTVLPQQGARYLMGLNLNFWPPMLASYINPPLARVKTATPC